MTAFRDDSTEAIGERLRTLRCAYGYVIGQAAFARFVGITPQSWNNYERGRRRIEIEAARKVALVTGVTLDWIYEGKRSGIALDTAQRLAKWEAAGADQRSA